MIRPDLDEVAEMKIEECRHVESNLDEVTGMHLRRLKITGASIPSGRSVALCLFSMIPCRTASARGGRMIRTVERFLSQRRVRMIPDPRLSDSTTVHVAFCLAGARIRSRFLSAVK